ncbi:hypothetical protein CF319_g2871 [Tilletia indica]|nr:hypothetical protein CF319_g2871 [Tilletia indica]
MHHLSPSRPSLSLFTIASLMLQFVSCRQDSRIGGREDGEAKGSEARSTPPIGCRLLSSGLRFGRLHWVRRPRSSARGWGVLRPCRDASWAMGTQRRGVAGTLLTAAGGTPFGDDAPAPLPAPILGPILKGVALVPAVHDAPCGLLASESAVVGEGRPGVNSPSEFSDFRSLAGFLIGLSHGAAVEGAHLVLSDRWVLPAPTPFVSVCTHRSRVVSAN